MSLDYRLNQTRLELSVPREVAGVDAGRCWYPDLLRFAGGELMLNHSLNADANDNAANAQAVYLSGDGGASFDFTYDVNGFHNGGGEPRLSLADGRIVGTSTFLKPEAGGQGRSFLAHRWTYDQGGRRYAVEPWGARVIGLPGVVPAYPTPSRTWWSRINWFSDIVSLGDGTWLSTISLHLGNDVLSSTVAVVSADEGRNWEYVSTVAAPADVPDAGEGFDEPALVQLDGGELLCVSRVGSGADQRLARRTSVDDGRTWSPLERLAAYSVAPQLCRLDNGVLLLSTGRPGLFLWCSVDGRGQRWEVVDMLAHHNAMVAAWPLTAAQTTAYTAMVAVAPDRVLLVYDRNPYGWEAVPAGSGERSQIWLVQVRAERG